ALAGKMVYGAKGTATGPVLKAVTRKGSALRCTFAEVGSGLVARETPVCGLARGLPARGTFAAAEHAFAIAGAHGKWHWAEAELQGNAVVVSSPDVPNPVRVRYAWSTYPPSMRLFNKEGFPAFPFQGKAK
ncbi:MAG: 9-O-acetylesterase, partial [Kiritimatiellae bacterium]|nr:9-O-acetylesterase [Kiritimatiellia bacterium]